MCLKLYKLRLKRVKFGGTEFELVSVSMAFALESLLTVVALVFSPYSRLVD